MLGFVFKLYTNGRHLDTLVRPVRSYFETILLNTMSLRALFYAKLIF